MPNNEASHNRARTKIVATVGPACREVEQLVALIKAGVDVFRVNTAHGDRQEHQQAVDAIRAASAHAKFPVGILVDLAGPKIRLGELVEDPTICNVGDRFTFVRGSQPRSKHEFVSNYDLLIDELNVGDLVMLADGTVGMQVVERQANLVQCQVTGAGVLRSRQGINLPGVNLSVPAMTQADFSNARWAAEAEVDFVSLSFVRSAVEVLQLKDLLVENGSSAMVIAKIEKSEAMDNLEAIVASADGIMVARGDLGVEIDVAETAVAQKKIIETCRWLSKPVIVATQMLDSMQRCRRPTRAEATDVANAILDGADACMLSGETAIGEFPRETVDMMNRIMHATERMLETQPFQNRVTHEITGVHPITTAVVRGAGEIASQLNARLVVIASDSGATARVKAKQREFTRTLGISGRDSTLRQMSLFWGIIPVAAAPLEDGPAMRDYISRWGQEHGYLASGDRVVFVTGSNLVRGAHNVLVVHEVP